MDNRLDQQRQHRQAFAKNNPQAYRNAVEQLERFEERLRQVESGLNAAGYIYDDGEWSRGNLPLLVGESLILEGHRQLKAEYMKVFKLIYGENK